MFSNWSGDASGTSTTTSTIVMDGPKVANATWITQYYLTTTTAHGTVTGSGWYNAGSAATVTLNSATSPGSNGVQYAFTNWGTDATGVTLTSNAITMDGPKTASTLWQTQYNLTFTQSGAGSDYTGDLVTVNGNAYSVAGFSTWANANSVYTFSYNPQAVVSSTTTQYLITGVNASATSVTVSEPTTITAAYRTQYYLTVTSAYDSPTPSSGWHDSGESITGYVSSPSSGYTCSGWTGTGSVPATGGSSVVTFTIAAPSSITWNWGSSTQPTATPTPTPANPTATPKATVKPTATPTPTPTPTNSTSTPTAKPTVTPTNSQQGQNSGDNTGMYAAVIVVVIVIVLVSIFLLLKRKK